MKLSYRLISLYEELCANYSADGVAVDVNDKKCFPWESQAVAWDTCGILEKHFFNPDTGKYSKEYGPIIKLFRESLTGLRNMLDDHDDPYIQVHANWWGVILTTLADERKSKLIT